MMGRTTVQKCEAASLGANVFPDASQLCGVNLDRGARNSFNRYYDWSRLATAPCALINPNRAQCYDTGDVQGYVVVGNGLSDNTFLPTFGGRRRTLLNTEEGGGDHAKKAGIPLNRTYHSRPPRVAPPSRHAFEKEESTKERFDRIKERIVAHGKFSGWDVVAQPCRDLVHSFLNPASAALGPVDLDVLEGCIHARDLGNQTVRELNLTAIGDAGNHFLMSFWDFASVMRRKGALKELLFTEVGSPPPIPQGKWVNPFPYLFPGGPPIPRYHVS